MSRPLRSAVAFIPRMTGGMTVHEIIPSILHTQNKVNPTIYKIHQAWWNYVFYVFEIETAKWIG
ncbi:hypothetical protein AYJ59_01845 [Thiomicrospira sp. S5]|nr:hypothetical protein AYJ59_01845 [Thiomicrospira sp. S5]